MNVRLAIDFDFLASAYLDAQIFCNRYTVQLELITNTMDHIDQNVALDRIRHMLYHEFSNALFISDSKSDLAKQFDQLGLKTCVLPGPPVDQLLGIMLFAKLNAVMQERLFLTQLKISSDLGDKLVYCQDSEEDLGPFEYTGWWHDSDNKIADASQDDTHGNVVELGNKIDPWHQFGLEWNKDTDTEAVLDFDG